MSKENSHAYALLRQRDALKRTRQVWVGLLVVWGVIVGWLAFALMNAVTDDVDVRVSWAIGWLLPVAIFAGGSLLVQMRLRACDANLRKVSG